MRTPTGGVRNFSASHFLYQRSGLKPGLLIFIIPSLKAGVIQNVLMYSVLLDSQYVFINPGFSLGAQGMLYIWALALNVATISKCLVVPGDPSEYLEQQDAVRQNTIPNES